MSSSNAQPAEQAGDANLARQFPGIDSARLMVGMEIHVELATESKMWTSAPNVAHRSRFDAPANSLLDPVVIGMPGVLPVMNRRAVEMSIQLGLALGCAIAQRCKWDRKSYYYPDLPKNYQISQYDQPLCGEGAIDIPAHGGPDAPLKKVRIIRAHLEEDAGKLMHEAPGGFPIEFSIVDLNRAGTPLLEIVTHPDLETPEQCVIFGQCLRDICRHLGISEGIMQKGHMRFEPNINVVIEKDGQTYKTPIVEIKNLNSFKALEGAVRHEFVRQIQEWLETGRVMGQRAKTTRGWDDVRLVTTLQRHKEDADEYRYFPDPDLVPLEVDAAWLDQLRADLPELPRERSARYLKQLKLNPKDAAAIVEEPELTRFFEAVLAEGVEPKRAAAMLLNYGQKRANERGCGVHELGITPNQIRQLSDLVANDRIGSSAADELFGVLCDSAMAEKNVEELASERNLIQVSDDSAMESWVAQAIAEQPQAADDVRSGKQAAIGRLVGAVMKASGGQANPKLAQQKLRQALGL